MRHDRWMMRTVKAAVLLGGVGLLGEGAFELKLVAAPFTDPESVPGRNKIIEHFIVQHLAFPTIGLLLVFAPARLRRLVESRLATGMLALIAVTVTAVEANTSRIDLFRPYPFNLHSALLNRIQMTDIGGRRINLLQATHLAFSHMALMGTIVALAILGPSALARFAGPRTGEDVFRDAQRR
jgi:hypothetical protein